MRNVKGYSSSFARRRAARAAYRASRRAARSMASRRSFRRRRVGRRQVVHKFFRWNSYVNDTEVAVPAATAGGPGFASLGQDHQLAAVPNVTEFSTLYDQFKIVRVYFRIQVNFDESTTPAASQLPEVYVVNDYDDSTAPTASSAGVDEMRQRPKMKIMRFTENRVVLHWKCRPKPLEEVYRSAIATSYKVPGRAPWLDCSHTDVPHYGTKFLFLNPSGVACTIRITRGFKILLRGVR